MDWATVITAVAAVISAVLSWRAATTAKTIHLLVNSRMDQLLKVTASGARAEGAKQATDAAAAKDGK